MFMAGGKKLTLDDKYVLYALNRKLAQDRAGASLGQNSVRAIDLMEFDLGMAKAKKSFALCLSSVKNFWRIASKRFVKPHSVEDMLQ
jgi:hypothetical protein